MFLAPFLLLLKNPPLENISCTCSVPLGQSLLLSVPHSHLLSDGIVSDTPEIHSSVAFRPSGGGGVETQVCCFCAKDKA